MVKRNDVVWEALDEIEQKYGLQHEFDYVHVQDLSDGTAAMTQQDIHGPGTGDTHLVVDRYLDRYADQTLENALVHEVLHSQQFNGDFGEKLQSQYGISEELSDRLDEVMTRGDRREVEGMTQALANRIVENGEIAGRYFYPYETMEFEKELEREGLDLDEEFDVEAYKAILENDLYGLEGRLEVGEDFLYHQVELGGTDYELLVIGDEVERYLEALDERYGLGQLETIYEDFDPDDPEVGFYFEDYRDVNYDGEPDNSAGTPPQEFPSSASMGTGTNGLPETDSRFGAT